MHLRFLYRKLARKNIVAAAFRKTFGIVLAISAFCINGCSQDSPHNFHDMHKIPINPKGWYILNNTAKGLEDLFNGKNKDKPELGYGLMLKNYDAYYAVGDGGHLNIDSIKMFDWEGTTEEHPTTIYAITEDWQRIKLATFTGERYNAWNGPDPKRPDIYALNQPIRNVCYLVINTWGNLPGEIEFYGSYSVPLHKQPAPVAYAPLKNFFGINAFEWDFEEPNTPYIPDPVRTRAIANFRAVRHYLDWDKIEGKEGTYSFAPASSGGWNYDTIYQWCNTNHIDILPCIKTVPPWLLETYPQDERDNENIPIRHGKDATSPASYIEQARAGFQFAARYGRNKNIDNKLIKLAGDNLLRVGLGTVQYIECDNERDKWWKGRKAYQTGREYAANLSAFYDGHKQSLGADVGVKNADTSMKIVMGGLAFPNPDYVRGMIDWCKEFRGTKADGKPDLPWDVINYHYYCNDADYTEGKKQSQGVPPEATKAAVIARAFVALGQQYGMPVWITEAGYDIDPESPQAAKAVKEKNILLTQADWLLRTSLLYSQAGIQKMFYYEHVDDNPKLNTQFATSGLINANRTNRPAADYFKQTIQQFGGYTYKKRINHNPVVDVYTKGRDTMYAAWVPSQTGENVKYPFHASTPAIYIYAPAIGSNTMKQTKMSTINGSVEITLSETPTFITLMNNN